MMKLKTPILMLKHYLVIVKIILILSLFISCKKEKNEVKSITVKQENSSFFKDELGKKYSDKRLVKEINFENRGRKLTSLFFLKEEGEIGTNNFTKELDVLIFENKNLLDKYSFENKSSLCDLKVLIEEIKILNQEENQVLYFPIIHNCDGEEPNLLIPNIWNGEKQKYEIEIPVYFENNDSKNDFVQNLTLVNFKSKQIKETVYDLITRITKIDLTNIKSVKSKEGKENPKCFTNSDVSQIKDFLSKPSEYEFSELFEKKGNVNLSTFNNYLLNKKCLGQEISISDVTNCSDKLKCEIYYSYNVTEEDIEEGELSEEIMFVYFNKINGMIYLNNIEFEGR